MTSYLPIEYRVEVLQKWKSKKGFEATYGRLLKACSDGRCETAAEKIVTLLGGKVTPAVPGTYVLVLSACIIQT